jgi:hypothetical protein
MGVSVSKFSTCYTTKVVQVKPSHEELVLTNKYYLDELAGLRNQFQEDSTHINFGEKAMFVMYAPPEYPTDWAAKYLGELLKIPVLHPEDYVQQLGGGSSVSNSRSIKNMSSRYLLRQSSSSDESPTREALRRRLYKKDCENGCIVYEYPDTCRELKYVMKNMASHLKVYLLFLELDNEVMCSHICD